MSEGNHSSHPETAFFLKSVPQQKGGGRKLYYVKPYSPFVDQQVCVWFTIKIVADLISLLNVFMETNFRKQIKKNLN